MRIFEIDVDFEFDNSLAFWVFAPDRYAATARLNVALPAAGYAIAAFTAIAEVGAVPEGVSPALVLR